MRSTLPRLPPLPGGAPGGLTPGGGGGLLDGIDPRKTRFIDGTEKPGRDTLVKTGRGAQERQATTAAAGSRIAIPYGRVRVGASVFAVAVSGGRLLLGCLWGAGEVEAIETLYIDGEPAPAAITATHYTGTAAQGVDPLLAAAIAGYDDRLVITVGNQTVGLAYSVVSVPADASAGFPRVEAVLRGRKIYDPRTHQRAYSANPALVCLDVLSDPVHGLGQGVDWMGSLPAIDACDALVGGSPRRTVGLLIDRAATTAQWLDTLEGYAGAWRVRGPDGWRLVPLRPAIPVRHMTAADIRQGTLRVRRAKRADLPTVVTVIYTDTQANPWRDRQATAHAAGVLAGGVPWRESVVRLPGINTFAQAYREAVERLNTAQLCDLSVEFETFDEALALEQGDVITLSHPVGLDAKPLRVSSVRGRRAGRYIVSATEYDAGVYSDAVVSDPMTPDTGLPSPLTPPPACTGLAVVEEVYTTQTGIYATRLRATWDASSWPYSAGYRVDIESGGALAWRVETRTPEAVTAALREGDTYTCSVRAVSVAGVEGDAAALTLVAQGKAMPPGDVPAITGYEVGGEVHLAWDRAVDVDIWRYEVRYGPTSGTWETAAMLDRVDGLRLVSRDVPAGPWRFWVKAVDSVGGVSALAASVDIIVTLDANAFFVGGGVVARDSGGGMSMYSTRMVGDVWVTDHDATIGATTFQDFSATPLVLMQPQGASVWLSNAHDFGAVITGTFSAGITYQPVRGSPAVRVQISLDGATWTTGAGMSVSGRARYARLLLSGAASDVVVVTGSATLRCDAQVLTRRGECTTTSAGVPASVAVEGGFYAVAAITLTPRTTGAAYAVYDNVQIGADAVTFDVYAFNAAGERIAVPVTYQFDGF